MYKDIKRKGLKNIKKNYLFLVFLCLIAAFISIEFIGSLTFAKRFSDKNLTNQKFLINDYIKFDDSNKIFEPKNVIETTFYDTFSGTMTFKSYQAIKNTFFVSEKYIIPLILTSLIIAFIIWFIFINPFMVIIRRFFLENRLYEKLSKERFLYLYKTKKILNVSYTLLIMRFYLFLYLFTIVGFFIKRYSYYLVPYILAENPNIKTKDAIRLSEELMEGHKFECFKLEFSFLGWHLLGIITLGITKVFFSNIYEMTTFSEYYYQIRQLGKKKKIKNIEQLNDTYLYEKASKDIIEEKYNDIIITEKNMNQKFKISKFKLFILKNFGISLINSKTLNEYNKSQYNIIKISDSKNEINRLSYPVRLSNIKDIRKLKILTTRNYLECYDILSLISMFLIFSIIGWIWEVGLRFIEQGVFVNKGALNGPWLPIYGRGIILILIILYRFRNNPKKEFLLMIILCGFIEYFTGLYLELTHDGHRWWDYSGYFLNLHGRICAEGLLVFGFGGLLVVYFVAPIIQKLLLKVKRNILILICSFVFLCFIGDEIYSTIHPNMDASIEITNNVIKG